MGRFDRLTDIVVLKINGSQLPVIPCNLQRLSQIGDIVLAIGNPFNLGQTVTQGVESSGNIGFSIPAKIALEVM